MTDELDDLKAAMKAATPPPDPGVKAAHMALAEKNFADLQGSRDETRLTSNRPTRGLWTGVKTMLKTFTTRAALTTSTAVLALGFVAFNVIDTQPSGPRFFGSYDEASIPKPVTKAETQAETETHEQTAAAQSAPTDDAAVRSREEERQSADNRQIAQQLPSEAEPAAEPEALGATAQFLDMAETDAITEEAFEAAPLAEAVTIAPQSTATVSTLQKRSVAEPVILPQESNTETFANEIPNPLKITVEEPVSTFSIDVDTASYAVIRNSLMRGQLPDSQAVRIEEMINYFPYDYPAPDGEAFRPSISVSETPWNPDTQLVHIGIQGEMPEVDNRPPLNLVFLIDTSGSMQDASKLPLLKQSFRLMLGQLRPDDQVSIVTYAGSAGQVLEPTNASERQTILNALEQLHAGDSTAGQAGLQQAYATAATMADEGEVTRVILATDGDFNVGIHDPEQLKDFIADKRDTGVYLSVLGFGRGNLQDATMQALAQNGNGQAAYIDTLAEAQKVLVDQLTGVLFPIANDVKIQVEFNPAQIAEYRLIGYETRALRREDFNNDAVDAGDIGAGHTVTAIYEVTPVGSPAQLSVPLRYHAADTTSEVDPSDELGFFKLRYKEPGETRSQLIEIPITQDMAPLTDAGFATAIAGFGQLLHDGDHVIGWSFDDAITLANATKGNDPYGYRAEAIQLMRIAASLSEN